MHKKLTLLTFTFCCFTLSFGQITITEINKKVETEAEKPPTYDSSKKFEFFDIYKSDKQFTPYDPNYPKTEDLFYKQYVGLKIFSPPCDNDQLNNFYCYSPSFLKLDKTINYFGQKCDSVMTFVYKPTFIEEGSGYSSRTDYDASRVSFYTNCKETGNKYYTIIDFLNRDSLIAIRGRFGNYFDREYLKQNKIFNQNINDDFINKQIAFVLKDDISGDTILSLGSLNSFILVPYFVKQQKMFHGKTFTLLTTHSDDPDGKENFILKDLITDEDVTLQNKSNWTCEVTLLDYNKATNKSKAANTKNTKQLGQSISNQEFYIGYVFKNGTQTIALFDNKTIKSVSNIGIENQGYGINRYSFAFILSDVYAKQEAEKRLKREELIAKQKKDEIEKANKIKIAKESFLKECINRFGQVNGDLISRGKVKIGMTTEMCETSWGNPFDRYKTTTASGTKESWYYGWKRSLHFVDGTLVRIDE